MMESLEINKNRKVSTETFHSPEIAEVIGRVPGSLLRMGGGIILIVLVSLILMSWLIKYPDLLSAKVIITTSPKPMTLVSRSSGILTILRKDGDQVQKGDIIAYINTNADLLAVLHEESSLIMGADSSLRKSQGQLGDLQPYHSEFISGLNSWNSIKSNKLIEKQIGQLRIQIEVYEQIGKTLEKQRKLAERESIRLNQKHTTDSVLALQLVLSPMDYAAAEIDWLQQLRSINNIETNVLNNQNLINHLKKEIIDLEVTLNEQKLKLETEVLQSRQNLIAQINKWRNQYLFVSNSKGRLAYLGFWESGSFVEMNKNLFSIIPNEGGLVVHGELPILGSGKVKVGQTVNIQLDNYPSAQFGMLEGKIAAISELPGDGKYLLNITLANGLLTTQNKEIPFNRQLEGQTQIITEDYRILERLLFQFRMLVKRS